jgi:hypothetical protein
VNRINSFGYGVPMKLIEANDGVPINGVIMPKELYWVLGSRPPPRWHEVPPNRFSLVEPQGRRFLSSRVASPRFLQSSPLVDWFHRASSSTWSAAVHRSTKPRRKQKSRKPSPPTVVAWGSGLGVVVHCMGGRGRDRNGARMWYCANLGSRQQRQSVFLDRVHKARGKPGWPESPWQSSLDRTLGSLSWCATYIGWRFAGGKVSPSAASRHC